MQTRWSFDYEYLEEILLLLKFGESRTESRFVNFGNKLSGFFHVIRMKIERLIVLKVMIVFDLRTSHILSRENVFETNNSTKYNESKQMR